MTSYDSQYGETEHFFGREPEVILRQHLSCLDPRRPVLDIGVGQGRNTLFLARHGFRIDAIDPSTVAVDTIRQKADSEKLPVRVLAWGFEDLPSGSNAPEWNTHEGISPFGPPYGGVLVFGIIQVLSWDAIQMLEARLDRWLDARGLVYLTAFSTADASYAKYARQWRKAGSNSFASDAGEVRTYLEPNQILTLFKNYESVHHWEGLGPEHRHGTGPVQRHARVEAVLRTPARLGPEVIP